MTDSCEKNVSKPERYLNFDVMKAVTLIPMVVVHLIERGMFLEKYDVNRLGFESFDMGGVTVIQIFDGLIGATVFMFCLGIGLVFSKRQTPKFLIKRSGITLALALGLALLTNTISLIIKSYLLQDPELFNQAIWWLFCCDILNFATLVFLFFALVRKFKLPNVIVILIPIILLIISEFIPKMIFSDNIIASDLIGWLVFQQTDYSCFPFMQWLIFPVAGYIFAQMLKKTVNKEKFFLISMLIGAGTFTLITGITSLCGVDVTSFLSYYHESIYNKTVLSATWSLSFILFWASLLYFLTRRISRTSLFCRVTEKFSRRITVYYCLQWIIIGFLVFWIFPIFGLLPLTLNEVLIASPIIIVICYYLAGVILKKLQKWRLSA